MSSTIDNNNIILTCANCGKEDAEDNSLKVCVACKMVKYCNRECQIAHRPQHKRACKERATELYDEALFKDPRPREDCPICMLPLPLERGEATFESCCGKVICNGCNVAMVKEATLKRKSKDDAMSKGRMGACAFCRTPPPSSDKEAIERIRELVKSDNAEAYYSLGGVYERGVMGVSQDRAKARELYQRAGELGCADAYFNLGVDYNNGHAANDKDKKKARHFYELAAMNGGVQARHNVGNIEGRAGNNHRALKHFKISASAGYALSLGAVKNGYLMGMISKDEYANVLRTYQKQTDEMKSEMRDLAAEFYRYSKARGI